jgi:ABC-2 type transport system ATP-binding protein
MVAIHPHPQSAQQANRTLARPELAIAEGGEPIEDLAARRRVLAKAWPLDGVVHASRWGIADSDSRVCDDEGYEQAELHGPPDPRRVPNVRRAPHPYAQGLVERRVAIVPRMLRSMTAVWVRGLRKQYGDIEAVAGIDLDVAAGEVFGFLGPNGAGKSTTIKILCTLSRPSSGEAKVAGFDVVRERDQVRRHIGLVFQETTLDDYLTAEMNLRFHAELYDMPRSQIASRLESVLQMVGLWDRRGHRVQTFSGGMKRRLEIARGLMHSPRVLFLDEPTVGLDPQTRASIWQYIGELRRREQVTIFLTTHYMDEAEYCDRIAIVDGGRIVALDTPAQLKTAVNEDRISITTADDAAALGRLRELGMEPALREGHVTFAVANGEEFVPRLFGELGVAIRSVAVARPSLDDVFLSHTGTTIRDKEQQAEDPMARIKRARR